MLSTPFLFEPEFTAAEFEMLGRLSIRWALVDHIMGNCLKTLLGLTDDQALVMVFQMGADARQTAINELAEKAKLNKEAKAALDELKWVMPGIRQIRNNVAHAVVMKDKDGNHHFENRKKGRKSSKEEVLASEELTNYAAHAVYSLRYALGLKDDPGARFPLPNRPPVPACLKGYFLAMSQGRKGRRAAQRESSRGSPKGASGA